MQLILPVKINSLLFDKWLQFNYMHVRPFLLVKIGRKKEIERAFFYVIKKNASEVKSVELSWLKYWDRSRGEGSGGGGDSIEPKNS